MNNLSGNIPQELSQLSMLSYFNVSSNNLCGPIPTGTQFVDTFINVTTYERNKCLCGNPLPPCKEKHVAQVTGDEKVKRRWKWLNHINEKVSLVALGLGVGIGFSGVVIVMASWKKATQWVVPSKKRPFYGVYRFPT